MHAPEFLLHLLSLEKVQNHQLRWSMDVNRYYAYSYSTGKLGFDPDIWNNKLKLSGYVEEAYLTTVPKVPTNLVAEFSKMAE